MKKVVYLAPIFLLSFLGKNALAGQVEHVSNLDSALEQASAINNSTADTNKNTTVLQSQVLRINKTNQTAIPDSIKQSTDFQDKKIAANTNVTINNPANNRIHVHWVDANGQNISNTNNGYDIDLTKVKAQDSYRWIPKGYQLHNPDGKYTVSGGAFNGANLHASTDYTPAVTKRHPAVTKRHRAVTHTVTQWAEYDDGQYKTIYGLSDYAKKHAEQEYKDNVLAVTGDGAPKWQKQTETIIDKPAWTETITPAWTETITPAYTTQTLPVAFVDSNNNNIIGMVQNYTGKVGTTQNVSLTVPTGYKLADGQSLPTSVTFQNSTNPLLVKVVPSGKTQSVTNPANNTINVKFVDQESGQQVGTDAINLIKAHNGTNYYNVPKGYSAANNSYRVGTTGYSWTMGEKSGTLEADDDGLLYTYKMFGVDPNKELKVKYASADRDYVEANGKAYALEDYHDAFPNNTQVTVSEYRKLKDFWNSFGFIPTVSHPVYTFTPSDELTDAYNTISGNTVTVPVHRTNRFTFSDNSGNVKSYSGNTVNVILEHQTKRIDPNNSSLNLDANNQLHLINTNQEQPKQSTANFKVGYLLDLVTNNKIIDTNNAQALNNTKIFTVNPSLPIGYDSLNTKLLTLNL